MKKIREEQALSFDDVLLVPKYYSGSSRKETNLGTTIAGLKLSLPIISANMPSVTGLEMAAVMAQAGGLGILDRVTGTKPETVRIFKEENPPSQKIGVSIGIGEGWQFDAEDYIHLGADLICIDVAHANQDKVRNVYANFRRTWPTHPLIIGNWAQPDWLDIMEDDDFLAMKIGIGGGSVCTTRIQTGCGMPTFQSVLDCRRNSNANLIADGGIKNSGDIVKALATGADAVMIGSLLAGTDEAPGTIWCGKAGYKFKSYRGNASAFVKAAGGLSSEFIEGAETLVRCKGPAANILKQLEDGIRSGLSYCGAMNLAQLRQNAEFVKISPAGYKESLPHGTL